MLVPRPEGGGSPARSAEIALICHPRLGAVAHDVLRLLVVNFCECQKGNLDLGVQN